MISLVVLSDAKVPTQLENLENLENEKKKFPSLEKSWKKEKHENVLEKSWKFSEKWI